VTGIHLTDGQVIALDKAAASKMEIKRVGINNKAQAGRSRRTAVILKAGIQDSISRLRVLEAPLSRLEIRERLVRAFGVGRVATPINHGESTQRAQQRVQAKHRGAPNCT
jgi:hypothetical protein